MLSRQDARQQLGEWEGSRVAAGCKGGVWCVVWCGVAA